MKPKLVTYQMIERRKRRMAIAFISILCVLIAGTFVGVFYLQHQYEITCNQRGGHLVTTDAKGYSICVSQDGRVLDG